MISREPHIAATIERDSTYFFTGQAVLGTKILKQPATIGILTNSVSQSATVGANPHASLTVQSETHHIIRHENMVMIPF